MALHDTLSLIDERKAAQQRYRAETPRRVERWRADLSALYDRIERDLAGEVTPGLLSYERVERDDEQLDLGRFSTIDLYFAVRGERIVQFEAKANRGDVNVAHIGHVEVRGLEGKGVGCLRCLAAGPDGGPAWSISAARDRAELAHRDPRWLDRLTLHDAIDTVLTERA